MCKLEVQKTWQLSEVSDLFYEEIVPSIDRIKALARAAMVCSIYHEEGGNVADLNAIEVLTDYIRVECDKVRGLEQRVMNGPVSLIDATLAQEPEQATG